ncbi:hypothetical protein acdb102_29230 [Acidothermaceae bacterium B102]|nr:hypothetical protein acdb102_29230 [Acidothermaceae bacterium B102]
MPSALEVERMSAVPTERSAQSRVSALLCALPLALCAAIAGLTLVAAVFLLADDYRAALVLPVGLVVAGLSGWLVLWRAPDVDSRTVWATLAAFAVVAVVVGFNLHFGAQEIVVSRDQGTYGLTAQWLAHHASAHIATDAQVFGSSVGLGPSSLGFLDAQPGFLQSQYPNAAPMLVAMGGWLSDSWLLRIAPLIGGAALLAFFGLARGVVRDWWALGAMTLLAVSLPMLHFSRAVYSEPTAMVFLLGGMGLLFACEQRGGVWLHLATGLTGGATALARVDGGIFLLAACGYAVLRLARTRTRGRTFAEVSALVLVALVPYAIGMRVVATLSPAYWYGPSGHWRGASAHAPEAVLPGVVALLVLLVGVPVVAVAWRAGKVRSGGVRTLGWLTSAFAVLLIVAAIVGATRPLWFTAHQYIGPTFTNWIRYWQSQEHSPLDGTRSYGEYTLNWLSWYDSVIVVVLGVVGIAWLVRRVGRTGNPPLVGFLLVLLPFGLVSLAYPDITADQIWSMRRFLPIVIPGFLIAAAYVGQRLWRYGRRSQIGVGVLALAALGLTLQTTSALATTREGVPQLAEIENVCGNLPAHAAVVVTGSAGYVTGSTMTVRSYCRVPAAGLSIDHDPNGHAIAIDASALMAIKQSAAASGRTLVVLTDDAKVLPSLTGVAPVVTPLSHISTNFWLPVLDHAVHDPWPSSRTLYLVSVNADGTVSSPAGQHTLTATG